MKHEYHFVTRWSVRGTVDAVYRILWDAKDYPRWWGDCYLSVTQEKERGAFGLSGVYKIINRGKLPYTLTWYSTVMSKDVHGFTIQATGELAGTGRWEFTQKGEMVDIVFYWDVLLGKKWLRTFSFLLKSILVSNHHWVMDRGETHLQEELERETA